MSGTNDATGGAPSTVDGILLTLGSNLRTAREKRRIDRSRLATRVGWTPSRLEQVENGDREVTILEFLRLAEAPGVRPSELTAGL